MTRKLTFEYLKDDLEPLNDDLLIQDYEDYLIIIIASTGLNNRVEVKAVFFLRVQNPCSEKA